MESFGVRLVEHAEFGNCLEAARAFVAGEVVLKERPLVHVPSRPLSIELERDSFNYRDLPLNSLRQAQVAASGDVRRRILKDMHIPDVTSPGLRDTKSAKLCKKVAAFSAGRLGVDEQELERSMLAFEVNAHGFLGGSALFELGSKLTHTCGNPNTMYKSTEDGYGSHIAVTDIKPGDLLTTTYVGEEHLLMSAPARQRFLLDNFIFHCKCAACVAEPDWFRGLPCLSCHPDARHSVHNVIKGTYASGHKPLRGIVYYHPKAAPEKPWMCQMCGTAFEDDPIQLGLVTKLEDYVLHNFDARARLINAKPFDASQVEKSLEEQVIRLEARLDEHPISDMRLSLELWRDCLAFLGPGHWATYRMRLINAECLVGEVAGPAMMPMMLMGSDAKTSMQDGLWELQDNIDATIKWLDGLPESPYRRSMPNLISTVLFNISRQLMSVASSSLLPRSFQPVQSLAAQLTQRFIGIAKASFGAVYDNLPEQSKLLGQMEGPHSQQALGGAGWRESAGPLARMDVLRSFLPPVAPIPGTSSKKRQGKKGKGHKKKRQ